MALRNPVRYASGRHAKAFLVALICVAALIVLVWPIAPDSSFAVIPVALLSGRQVRWTPLWELLPAGVASIGPALMSSGMPHLDGLGGRELRPYAGVSAFVLVAFCSLLPVLAGTTLPDGARIDLSVSNTAIVAGSALLLTSWFGRRLGPILAFGLYACLVLIQHLTPEVGVHLPFALLLPFPGHEGNMVPHPLAASLAVFAGIALWTVRRGVPLNGV